MLRTIVGHPEHTRGMDRVLFFVVYEMKFAVGVYESDLCLNDID